jgi:WD40 repeat protein
MLQLFFSVFLALVIAPLPTVPAPKVFEPQILDSAALSPAFSPDGETMLFTRQWDHSSVIMESHQTDSGWSRPRVAAFSGRYLDMDPAFSPDGSYVVFASARPAPDVRGDTLNLWTIKRRGATWGNATHLPRSVNVSMYAFAPSIARDGTIYFMAMTKTHERQLYSVRRQGEAFEQARPLGFSSPPTRDADPLVAPDQSFVLFVSGGRNGAKDRRQHIYIARANGQVWQAPQPVLYQGEFDGETDCCLQFAPDGKTLLFLGTRGNVSRVYSIPVP